MKRCDMCGRLMQEGHPVTAGVFGDLEVPVPDPIPGWAKYYRQGEECEECHNEWEWIAEQIEKEEGHK